MHVPLRIVDTRTPCREAAAWFVPGGEPAAWLDEIAGWGVAVSKLSLFVLPASAADRRAAGLLAVAPAGSKPQVSPRCLAYGRLGRRLFLPVEAELEPQVTADEIEAMLPDDAEVCVWRPAAGLAAFEANDELRASDLFAMPPPRATPWRQPQGTPRFNDRIVSLTPELPPRIDDFLAQSREDIGSQSRSLRELPPAPGEPSDSPASQAARRARSALARMARWLANKAQAERPKPPASGAAQERPRPSRRRGANWLGGLAEAVGQWSQRRLERLAQELDSLRMREIDRLLKMLSDDPERGLRYALPLAGAPSHRGMAPPGAWLTPRSVDYSAGRSGGAADVWDLDWRRRQALIEKYRALAEREIRLGRFRRAAYIYAELLGDFASAAQTLSQGRHWREAAALYEDRLGRPGEAARCLENGGLLFEAIALWESLGEFERAGDLYLRVDDPERAEAAYRIEAAHRTDRRDWLAAARLLETKLHDPDAALSALALGWPASSQAQLCLKETFRILARLGRHAHARRWVERLRDDPAGRHVEARTEGLVEAATSYPDPPIRALAADGARVAASHGLRQADRPLCERLLGLVTRLAPQDRLLSRDCQRYLKGERAARPPLAGARPARRPAALHRFSLPGGVDWSAAVSMGGAFYVAGRRGEQIVLTRVSWTDRQRPMTTLAWSGEDEPSPTPWSTSDTIFAAPLPSSGLRLPLLLAADPVSAGRLVLHEIGRPPLAEKSFVATDLFSQPIKAGGIGALRFDTVGLTIDAARSVWTVGFANGDVTLYGHGIDGALIASRPIGPPPEGWHGFDLPTPLCVKTGAAYLLTGQHLVTSRSGGRIAWEALPSPAWSLCSSPAFTHPRLALGAEQGGFLLWPEREQLALERFAADLHRPALCFLPGGWLVAASEEQIEVYQVTERRLTLHATAPSFLRRPLLAALPIADRDRFVLVYEGGQAVLAAVGP